MDSAPQKELVAVGALFLVLTITTTALRCYVRMVMVKSFGWDDVLAVLSLFLFIATVVTVLEGVNYSKGRHMVEIPLADIPTAMMWWYFCELCYISTTICIRLSIAIYLRRLIVSKLHLGILLGVMGITTAYSIGYFVAMTFQCSPISYFWTAIEGKSGTCLTPALVGDLTFIHGILSIIADWTLAILPTFLVWNLKMNPRTKKTLAVILGLGSIGSCGVIIRFPYVVALVNNSTDFLYYCTNVVLWTSIEPGLAITAASLATLRPLFKTFLSRSHNLNIKYKSSLNSNYVSNCMSLGLGLGLGVGKSNGHSTVKSKSKGRSGSKDKKSRRESKPSGTYVRSGSGRDQWSYPDVGRDVDIELQRFGIGNEKEMQNGVSTTTITTTTIISSPNTGTGRTETQNWEESHHFRSFSQESWNGSTEMFSYRSDDGDDGGEMGIGNLGNLAPAPVHHRLGLGERERESPLEITKTVEVRVRRT